MAYTLHNFQSEMVDRARTVISGGAKSVILHAPTGAGKTVMASSILESAARKGRRSWFIVHRRELVGQAVRTFTEASVEVGIVAAGSPLTPERPVQVCSIGSLSRRMDSLAQPDLVVWDECHHCVATTWATIHQRLPDAVHVGLTATPERLDGAGLRPHFGEMVSGPTTKWLIDHNYLVPFRYFAAPAISLAGVSRTAGDYDRGDLARVMDKPSITGDAVAHYLRVAPGRRAVVFAVNRAHSKAIVEAFKQSGVAAYHVDGTTPTAERDAAVSAFRSGELDLLSNVDLFGEGFDLPALEVAILMRPTQSLALFLQQVGRALRTSPDKEKAIILDHASNCRMHGLPDVDRDWSLDGKKGRQGVAVSVRLCDECFAAIPAGAPCCPECGCVFTVEPKEDIATVKGELEEITPETREFMRRNAAREQAQARTHGELVALAIRRGYARPDGWAWNVLRSRRARFG